MSIPPYPWPVRLLPAKRFCKKGDDAAITKYEAMSDIEKQNFGGHWWSMHDIIQELGGMISEENDANYFGVVIDLSSPEMAKSRLVDPTMVSLLDNQMKSNLNELSNKIRSEFQNQQLASAAATTSAVTGVAAARPMMGFPGMPSGPGMGQDMGQIQGMGQGPAEPAYSVNNLEKECFKDMSRIPFHSKSRIFVVQKDLPMATAAMKESIERGDFETISAANPTGLNNENNAPGINLGTVPVPAPIQTGGIIKTRKGKKSHKKRKTRRHKRRRSKL